MDVRESVQEAERILVVAKLRFMGDSIVATPFLAELRRLAPAANITLMCAPTAAMALMHCPYVDQLVPVEVTGRTRSEQTGQLLRLLRDQHAEVVFLLNRSVHAAWICARAEIPLRIGYLHIASWPLLDLRIPYRVERHEIDCHLDMVRALGVDAGFRLPDLWFTDVERSRSRQTLMGRGWRGEGQPLIGVQPGANDPELREWGHARFAAAADALAERIDGRVVLMGGQSERDTASRTAAVMRYPAINLVGALALRDSLAVIGQCDLWVGNDTGLLHAAAAQRVPSVGLFGPTKRARWGYEQPCHRSLSVELKRGARDDKTLRRSLDAIDEEAVIDAAMSVYQERLACSERAAAVAVSG
jgi:heptosyltransferase-2